MALPIARRLPVWRLVTLFLWSYLLSCQGRNLVARGDLAGDYRRTGATFQIDLHLSAAGNYRLVWITDMGADEPQHGTWSLSPNGKVILHGQSNDARHTADVFGPLSVLPDSHGGSILVGDKELLRYTRPAAAAFRRIALPAVLAISASPAT